MTATDEPEGYRRQTWRVNGMAELLDTLEDWVATATAEGFHPTAIRATGNPTRGQRLYVTVDWITDVEYRRRKLARDRGTDRDRDA